ncbi:MAG: condensation domain-containing protein [Thermodesulfobacteriota bacterium]
MKNTPQIPQEATRLDPLSEMLALSARGNSKNVIVVGVELQGSVDLELMVEATHRAVKAYPHFQTCLREVKERGGYFLYREPRPDLEFPVFVHSMEETPPSQTPMDAVLSRMTPRLDREWDLLRELPAECHCFRFSDDFYVVCPVMHHSAGDGGTAAEFGREILLTYHELLTGQKPGASCYRQGMSTGQKRMARPRKKTWKDLFFSARNSLTPVFSRSSLPEGTGTADDPRQHQTKRILSQEETERIMKASQARGASLVDALAASTALAVDIWNGERGVQPGVLTTSISVNMRGRRQELDTANNSGLLYFRSTPEQREDADQFARLISTARISQFRKHMDLEFYENVVRMNSALRRLPYETRRRIVHFISNKHQVSVAVTLLGVIWPEEKNGRPTANSCLIQVGEAEALQVYGIGYKLLSSTHLLLIVYFFRNKLNLALAASACLFTREEAEAFLNLIQEQLVERALEKS